ncbi:DUF6086 family protein [Streptomyces platensis]|uniref:DUF6086 family protein n=1 Tax=Streptomyces platensis TaxID=58346 RepID=UPI00369E44D2
MLSFLGFWLTFRGEGLPVVYEPGERLSGRTGSAVRHRPVQADECQIDPVVFKAFVDALLTWHRRTSHAVMAALAEGFDQRSCRPLVSRLPRRPSRHSLSVRLSHHTDNQP